MERKEIIFRLSRPFKVSRTAAVSRVQLLLLLTNGVLQILDREGKPLERFFIKGGVADVARNRCAVSTEKVVSFDKIDLLRATEKRDEAILPEDKTFYQMIVDYLSLQSARK